MTVQCQLFRESADRQYEGMTTYGFTLEFDLASGAAELPHEQRGATASIPELSPRR